MGLSVTLLAHILSSELDKISDGSSEATVDIHKIFDSNGLSIQADISVDGESLNDTNPSAEALAAKLEEILAYVNFSNNLDEEIDDRMDENLGDNPVVKKTTSKVTIKKIKATKGSQLRDLGGRFYSAALLADYIRTNLFEAISNNMGNEPWPGGQRKILNYRTGRFAATTQLEQLTVSREGMITAYYNYMKYPYQTFEPGYAQGSPESRNPRLLIAKSIRELAAKKVRNKMRAVLV